MKDNIIFRSGSEIQTEPLAAVAEITTDELHIQYIGYARRGSKTLDDKSYCILRIMCNRETGVTTYMYSNGSLERNVSFNERENIEYSFLI